MCLNAPRYNSFDIIVLHPVKKMIVIKTMGISAPWDNSIDIIALNPVKNTRY